MNSKKKQLRRPVYTSRLADRLDSRATKQTKKHTRKAFAKGTYIALWFGFALSGAYQFAHVVSKRLEFANGAGLVRFLLLLLGL